MNNTIQNISDADLFYGLISELMIPKHADLPFGSLLELYEARRQELNLTDNVVFKMLDLDAKQVKPILEGEAKRISLFTILKLAYFLNESLEGCSNLR